LLPRPGRWKELKTQAHPQVHDELLFEVHVDEIPSLTDFVRNKMESAWNLKVPLVVDISIGQSWAEAH